MSEAGFGVKYKAQVVSNVEEVYVESAFSSALPLAEIWSFLDGQAARLDSEHSTESPFVGKVWSVQSDLELTHP